MPNLSTAEKLLEELRRRGDLRRALAEELVSEMFRDRRLRLAVLMSLYRDIATKDDIKELRAEIEALRAELRALRAELGRFATKDEFKELRAELVKEISELRSRIWWVVGVMLTMWVTLTAAILLKP